MSFEKHIGVGTLFLVEYTLRAIQNGLSVGVGVSLVL